MNKRTKQISVISLLQIILIIAVAIVGKKTENVYSLDPSYHTLSIFFGTMYALFIALFAMNVYLLIKEVHRQIKTKKLKPMGFLFTLGVILAFVWMVAYTAPTCACGA